MKKILVTGAGGFIGSHLTEHLVREGYQVRALVRYNSQNSWGWLDTSEVRDDIEIFVGDVRDFDGISRATEGVDTIFHLAALIGIPYSYVSPLAYIRTNIEGTYNVVEAARNRGVSRVLVTSTSEVYGTARYAPIDEKHPHQPQSPYSATKIGADNFALSYFNSFDLPVTIVRPFNTYGPRQSARAIIPTVMTQLLTGAKRLKLGNLDPQRDLTFVQDTVTGMLAIAKCNEFVGQTVNIGVGETISIRDLCEKIFHTLSLRAELEEDSTRIRPEKSEVMKLLSDNQLLRSKTTWSPETSLDDGLKKTANWLEKNLSRYKAGIYNV